jgi:hypothetical protein
MADDHWLEVFAVLIEQHEEYVRYLLVTGQSENPFGVTVADQKATIAKLEQKRAARAKALRDGTVEVMTPQPELFPRPLLTWKGGHG